ncbi:MAG TPA: hypothetical protein VF701_07445 [Thermoanaerobaculia bacterium]
MNPRITLIVRTADRPDVDWNYNPSSGSRSLFLESVAGARFAVSSKELDVQRIVLHRIGDSSAFLELLSTLPAQFGGDVLMIAEDGSGFLSASGRGGDRILYALRTDDIRFYLETNDLVTGRMILRRSA